MEHDRGVAEQIVELERLDEIAVPDHRAVGDREIGERARDFDHFAQPFLEHLLRAEDRAMLLHGPLHRAAERTGFGPALRVADPVEPRDRGFRCGGRQSRMRCARLDNLGGALSRGAAEDEKIEQRVGAETRRTMYRDAGRLADGHQPGHGAFRIARGRVKHFAMNIGRDAAHVVMRRRKHRDRLARHLDAGKNFRSLRDAGQSRMQQPRIEMFEMQQHVVTLRPAAAALADLDLHRPADHVARTEIL